MICFIYGYALLSNYAGHLKEVYLVILYFSEADSEAGRGAAARGMTAKPTGCGFDPHSRR